ncbi:MAG: ribulose-phosphate 3-epimerase [Proteobacteria bacterium]|nr:ribulose-phosphate 3-epimerase [Pseudomonadota bacterium]
MCPRYTARVVKGIKIAPSILSADFSNLGEQVAEAAKGGADMVHIDVMDGQFVPAITLGPQMVDALRPWTDIPFDLHLMIAEPGRFVADFASAGADIITVHAEACTHLHRTIHQIKELGKKAGVAINPATPISAIEDLLPDLDQVLVMTVNPGFGGQSFISSMIAKIERIRGAINGAGLRSDLEVDGGINLGTAKTAADAGANILVAGSAVYNDRTSVAEAIGKLRESLE